ncbi:MAG TPA: glycosyltransferase [Chitinophagaceae bacterium]|jgi:glycosyltransferase involved in cell wall biosynthesis
MQKKIIFTVTNDLVYDQRMIRICRSLAGEGFQVLLVGVKRKGSPPLAGASFGQKRLAVFFGRGKLFYAEFNLRLFFFLLGQRADAACAIDLDTILPVHLVSRLRGIPRVYDAHELFCEMKEIVTRPAIYKIWKRIERFCVPAFRRGYTVNAIIAAEFEKMYGVQYEVIRSIARLEDVAPVEKTERFILYQGAVNEGRCFETLIPAMQKVPARLLICGDGNFRTQAQQLVKQYGLEEKVIFKGMLEPEALKMVTRSAYIGITLFDDTGKSNYYSLANRFFDYLQAGIPQLCVDYPAYRELNNLSEVAVLTKDVSTESIAASLNGLLENDQEYKRLAANCQKARLSLNWQEEEKKLIAFYHQLFL